MVKFEAPEHTRGSLAGYAVRGCWVTTPRDPQWRGDVGTEQYVWRHHWVPLRHYWGDVPDPADAVAEALAEWRPLHREPDHVSVDAVYASSLSRPAGSQDDPFIGLTGEQGGHDGYDPSGKSKERGRVSNG